MPRYRDQTHLKGESHRTAFLEYRAALLTPLTHPVSVIEYMSFSDADQAVKTLDGVEMRGSVVRVTPGQAAPGQTWEDPVSRSGFILTP